MKFSWWGLALLLVLAHLGLALWALREDWIKLLEVAGVSAVIILPYVLNSRARNLKVVLTEITILTVLSAYTLFWFWVFIALGVDTKSALWLVPAVATVLLVIVTEFMSAFVFVEPAVVSNILNKFVKDNEDP